LISKYQSENFLLLLLAQPDEDVVCPMHYLIDSEPGSPVADDVGEGKYDDVDESDIDKNYSDEDLNKIVDVERRYCLDCGTQFKNQRVCKNY
jgi:hypothetical protein